MRVIILKKDLSQWGSFYWVVPIVVIAIIIVALIEKKEYRRQVLWSMLAVWVLGLVYLTFLYRLPGGSGKVTYDFFHMYRTAGQYNGSLATNQAFRQILFNLLLYVPFGCVFSALSGWVWLSIVIGGALSILTEVLQYITGLGWADIDDVISNILGLILGVFLYRGIKRITSTR